MGAKGEIRPKWPAIYTFSGGKWCQEAVLQFVLCSSLIVAKGWARWKVSVIEPTQIWPPHIVPPTTYNLQCTWCIVPSTMYFSPPPAYQRHYLATLYPTQWVTHIVPDTMYSTQCAISSLPTLQSTTDTTQCERTM